MCRMLNHVYIENTSALDAGRGRLWRARLRARRPDQRRWPRPHLPRSNARMPHQRHAAVSASGRSPISRASTSVTATASDGGQSFRLRGRGAGAMPTAAEAIRAFPRMILIFKLSEPARRRRDRRRLPRGRDAIGDRHGFAGTPEAMARLRDADPGRLGARPGGERGLPLRLSPNRLDRHGAGRPVAARR